MKKKRLKHFFFVLAIFLSFIGNLASETQSSESLAFDKNLYMEIRNQKEEGSFNPQKDEINESQIDLSYQKAQKIEEIKQDIDKSLIQFNLPYQSKLNISGRKMVGFNYGLINYKSGEKRDQIEAPTDIKNGVDLRQEMQVRINGQIGNKINVKVNYDDKDLENKDISIVYKGYKKGDVIKGGTDEYGNNIEDIVVQKDEIIQELAFGDIQLEIPQTEFIGYQKTLFGLKAKAKYNNFNITAVASQTQGIFEKKVFEGKTTREHKYIEDRNFMRRKFYRLYFSAAQRGQYFPIIRGSEEIYLFDQVANPTGQTIYELPAERYGGGPEIKYKFRKLQTGRDYEIDYVNNNILFKISIAKNYVIAVDYKSNSGTKLSEDPSAGTVGRIKLLKDELNTISFNEINEYYDLGNVNITRGELNKDFIFRVLNTNDEILNFGYSDIDVDYYNGILKFNRDKPFQSYYDAGKSIYDDEYVTSKIKIEVEYSYEKANNYTYMLGKAIIKGSESISVDGRKLERDRDYIIDYEIGFITLLSTELISSESKVEVTYEYLPFGGQYQQTLLGARAEYRFTDKDYWGVSTIYSGSASPTEAPSVFSPPKSITIVDSDINFTLKKDDIILPFDLTIKGEIATSFQNANVFGKAIVENMDALKVSDYHGLDINNWQIASNPNNRPIFGAGKFDLLNHDVDLRQINPKVNLDKEQKVNVLSFNFNKISQNEEVSIVQVLNREGLDYSDKKFLEVWIYADEQAFSSAPSLYFRYGGIDEDADKKNGFSKKSGIWNVGDPKTEDLDGDGKLGATEDVGWEYFPEGWTTPIRIGAGNGILDSEDLNRNGILDPDDGMGAEFKNLVDENGISHNTVNWIGWKKFVIPLEITDKSKWRTIKHLRITVHSNSMSDISGNLKFYEFATVGNKWGDVTLTPASATTKFSIKSVSKENDSSYVSVLDDVVTKSEYQKLYKRTTQDTSLKEEALAMKFENLNNGATGYAIYRLPSDKKYNLSIYKKLKFFIFGDDSGAEFFINLGSDESNYFEYATKLDWRGWKIPELSLEDHKNLYGYNIPDGIPDGFTSCVGAPKISNIRYMRIGIRNKSGRVLSGQIFLNDIYVDDALKKDGVAYKTEAIMNFKNDIIVSGLLKHIDANFETITSGTQSNDLLGIGSITSGRETDSYSGKLDFNTLKFLPITVTAGRDTVETPKFTNTSISILEEGKIDSNNKTLNTAFNLKNFPRLTFSYQQVKADFFDLNLSSSTDYNLNETKNHELYYTRLDYSIPLSSRFYDQRIFSEFKTEKIKHDYFEVVTSTDIRNLDELKESYSFGTDLSLLSRLNLRPKYSYAEISEILDNKPETERYFRKREEKAEVSSEITLLNWLRPNFGYDLVKTEDFNIVQKSTYTTKDVRIENSGKAGLDLYFNAILSGFKPTKSLNLTFNYEIKDIEAWRGINADYKFLDFWFTRSYDGLVNNKAFNIAPKFGNQTTFSQEDIKTFSLKYSPFDYLEFKEKWLAPLQTLSTRFSYSETFVEGVTSDAAVVVWPEILTEIKNFENFLFLDGFVSNGELVTKYLNKTENSYAISDKYTKNFDTKYRFKVLETFDCALNYRADNFEEFNINNTKSVKVRSVDLNSYGAQLGLTYKSWRFTTRGDFKVQDEFLLNTNSKWVDEKIFSLKADTDFSVERGLKLPFIKKRFIVENRIKLSSEVKGTQKRGDLLEDNKDIYDFVADSEFNFTSNFQFKLGAKFSDVRFLLRDKSNYNAVLIQTEASIIF